LYNSLTIVLSVGYRI